MTSACDSFPKENQPVTSTNTTSALLAKFQKEHRERRLRLSRLPPKVIHVACDWNNWTLFGSGIKVVYKKTKTASLYWPTVPTGVTIAKIQKTVARHFGVKVHDIVGPYRGDDYVIPRHLAMLLSRELTTHSLPAIAKQFGNRDHTTILSAIKSIRKRMANRHGVASSYEYLFAELTGADDDEF
jgi:Bacterial dnaA protein helix-turn-helix